jgi:phosphatidylserine/phosphatidylglycerophosphate/cardiolipin synthase-like enzyme
MTTKPLRVYTRMEYFNLLVQLTGRTKRGERIAITTMPFDPEQPVIAELMRALCAAAARGVHVYFAVDAYTFLVRSGKVLPGPLWFHDKLPDTMPRPFENRLSILRALAKNGGHCAITNIPPKAFANPYAGRSHIKAAVIGDYVLVGGCNLESPTEVDCMVGLEQADTADWLYRLITNLVGTSSTSQTFEKRDRTHTIDSTTQLFIDAGVPGQSTIYRRALQLIDDAREHIFFTCQFFPGGQTGQHLLAAYKRGVDVRIIYAHPSEHGQTALGHWLYNTRERMRLPAALYADGRKHGTRYLHAKVIATEQGAMVGSHNYVTQGVNLGTAEIALLSLDPDFSRDVVQKMGSDLQ